MVRVVPRGSWPYRGAYDDAACGSRWDAAEKCYQRLFFPPGLDKGPIDADKAPTENAHTENAHTRVSPPGVRWEVRPLIAVSE